MATITVQEQLNIISQSKTVPTSLHGNGTFNAIIFATPQINMNPTVIDVKGRTWDHIDGSYYYKLPTGSSCPIFYIDRYE